MSKRKIIEINRDLCNGCGLCTTACAEGALEMDKEKKAVLVREIYCDGLGACLDVCPTGALKIVERDSRDYDVQAAYQHVLKTKGKEAAAQVHGFSRGSGHGAAMSARRHGRANAQDVVKTDHDSALSSCPGSLARVIPEETNIPGGAGEGTVSAASELRQWPIQLRLVSPFAPYFQNSDLLIAADCTSFAHGGFHRDLLKDKKLIIACPKLDETKSHVEKLADIIKINSLHSLTVAVMTVPCCSGLLRIVEEAVDLSGVPLDVKTVIIGIDGRFVS
jgi:ferredoxin